MATPTIKRKQLGNELRHLREEAGLTQEAAADLIEKTQGRIAELENGQRTIAPGDLRLLLEAYGVKDQARVDFFMELRRNNHQRGRWSGYRAAYPEQFRMFVDLEEDAELIQTVEAEIPPGLLQCERLVRALYATRRDWTEERRENAVQARLLRQKILFREPPTRAAFVLSESSLARRYGGAEVMREQIEHMITLSNRSNIQIQVLPFDSEADVTSEIGYSFTLFKISSPGVAGPLEFAYSEGADDNRYLDDKKAVTAHYAQWAGLSAAALSPEDSREFMREAVGKYHRG